MQVATSLDSRTERMSKNRHPLQSRRKQDDAQDQSSLSDRPSYGPWTAIKTVIHRCLFRPDMRHLQESRCYERDGNLNLDGDGEGDFIQSSLTHSKNQRQEPARRGGLEEEGFHQAQAQATSCKPLDERAPPMTVGHRRDVD